MKLAYKIDAGAIRLAPPSSLVSRFSAALLPRPRSRLSLCWSPRYRSANRSPIAGASKVFRSSIVFVRLSLAINLYCKLIC